MKKTILLAILITAGVTSVFSYLMFGSSGPNAQEAFEKGLDLQNIQKDYYGAIHQYMLCHEATDEGALRERASTQIVLAKDEIKKVHKKELEKELYQQWLTEHPPMDAERMNQLLEENNALLKATQEKDKQILDLERRIDHLKRTIDELTSIEVHAPVTDEEDLLSVKEAIAAASEDSTSEDDELGLEDVAAIRDLASTMITEEDGGQSKINEATHSAMAGKQDTETITATPTAGQRYVVRPKETYFSIARDAYGDAYGPGPKENWKVIREANRGKTNPDDRLLAGEIIFIPEL